MVREPPHCQAMTRRPTNIDPQALAPRLEALEGITELRAAALEPAYLVGGVVRDLLLGLPRSDIDVVVEGDPGALAERLGGAARVHERFGTVTVRRGRLQLDIARARTETYSRPGALPTVRPDTLAHDLSRRDFTINAMAIPLAGEPLLIDPLGGLDDLRQGLLRVLHNRSFADDPTRALRAARYAARLNLELEAGTARLLAACEPASVSADRVEVELRRICAEPVAVAALELISAWAIGTADADRAAAAAQTVAQPLYAALAARDAVVLAAAAPAVGRFVAGGEVQRAGELAAVDPSLPPSELTRSAHGATGVVLTLARALGAEWIDDYVDEWRHVRLEISGTDLLAAGVPEGAAIGRGLGKALAAKLDGGLNGRGAELAAAVEEARA